MGDPIHVSEADFQKEVLQAGTPVLVDFTAEWCAPCKMLDPIMKQLAQDWNGKVKIVKLDVDQNPDIAAQYQVLGLPTLMLFINGQPSQRMNGFQPRDRIVAKLGGLI